MGRKWKLWQVLFSWAPKSLQMVTAVMKLKDAPWKKSCDQPRLHIEKQRHHFTDKGLSSQSYGFSSSHVWMDLRVGHKECILGWVTKNWCFWTVVLEKTLESPLDCKIKPVNPNGYQPWIFIGTTYAEVEVPIFWQPDAKCQLIGKDSDAGEDWRQKKRVAENEIVR